MEELTERQKEILHLILKETETHGYKEVRSMAVAGIALHSQDFCSIHFCGVNKVFAAAIAALAMVYEFSSVIRWQID